MANKQAKRLQRYHERIFKDPALVEYRAMFARQCPAKKTDAVEFVRWLRKQARDDLHTYGLSRQHRNN